jgi:hypoxanthine phosphoribosyltransferase
MEPRPPRSSASPKQRRPARPDAAPPTPSIPSGPSPIPWPSTEAPAVTATAFAHASEAEFARILDFYGVRWEYEPHTFPILWNLEGGVAESFSPDFWLPDLELYVELTTLRQSLVRKKNRKLRRLRELYPDVRVKLFYGRDFRALMLKYGKLGLVQGLSGALGQSSLIRPVDAPHGEPLEEPLEEPAGVAVPDPTSIVGALDVVVLEPAGPGAGAPARAPDEESPPAATAASRSARRRRRRRAAAQLRRRAQPDEAPSQPSGRHEPLTRR